MRTHFSLPNMPKKGGRTAAPKNERKKGPTTVVGHFLRSFLGSAFRPPFFGPLTSPQKGSNDKAAVQASWFDSIITNRLKLCCSRTVGRHSVILAVHPFLNALVKRVDAHVASVE